MNWTNDAWIVFWFGAVISFLLIIWYVIHICKTEVDSSLPLDVKQEGGEEMEEINMKKEISVDKVNEFLDVWLTVLKDTKRTPQDKVDCLYTVISSFKNNIHEIIGDENNDTHN